MPGASHAALASAGARNRDPVLAACGTALATGLGAIPVFGRGSRAKALTPFLLGFAAGAMLGLIAVELLPSAYSGLRPLAPSTGVAAGAVPMLVLSLALGG